MTKKYYSNPNTGVAHESYVGILCVSNTGSSPELIPISYDTGNPAGGR